MERGAKEGGDSGGGGKRGRWRYGKNEKGGGNSEKGCGKTGGRRWEADRGPHKYGNTGKEDDMRGGGKKGVKDEQKKGDLYRCNIYTAMEKKKKIRKKKLFRRSDKYAAKNCRSFQW
jgi:hypothetical protein